MSAKSNVISRTFSADYDQFLKCVRLVTESIVLCGIFISLSVNLYAQPGVVFHIDSHLLQNKKIIKVKRDFKDPYLWVLADNNEIFRINSLNKEVLDYSSYFAPYSSFKFIDIAGISKDSAFVATSTNTLLYLRNGDIKVINAAMGLNNGINSIGLDYTGSPWRPGATQTNCLFIGAETNSYIYKTETDQLVINATGVRSEIYVATHNKMMARMTDVTSFPDTVNYYSVVFKTFYSMYQQFLWKGGTHFGQNINTAYYTFGSISEYLPRYQSSFGISGTYSNLYWGNENGMFQLNRNSSWSSAWPHKRYLPSIRVNKISSIHGLVGFGVLPYRYVATTKENMLVGTEKGLYYSDSYLLKPSSTFLNDFSLFQYLPLANTAVYDICVNVKSIWNDGFCEDGAWLATEKGLYFIKPDYTSSLNDKTYPAAKFKNQNSSVAEAELCSNSTLTAEIEESYRNSVSTIQWFKDGVGLVNQTNKELSINQAGIYHALIHESCSGLRIKSNSLKVVSVAAPEITFNYPDEIRLCKGEGITLNTISKEGYKFNWYKNGVLLPGEALSNYNVTTEGKYKVEVTACAGSSSFSKEISVHFDIIPTPVITTDKAIYCEGDVATLQIPPYPGADIKWLFNGIVQTEFNGSYFINAEKAGKYMVEISKANCKQFSSEMTLTFDNPPEFSINRRLNRSLCHGDMEVLTVSTPAARYLWSTGETTRSIQVKNAGEYEVEVFNSNNCSSKREVEVIALPRISLNKIPDTVLCLINNESIVIKADEGFVKYSLNGVASSFPHFTIKEPGSYTLIVEDSNGCTAEAVFTVKPLCLRIIIPNTFTPNGDMINDTWNIGGLENDSNADVKVYNRYGQLVFESAGNWTAWNGKSGSDELPAGVYFYVISTKNAEKPIKGIVNIIR